MPERRRVAQPCSPNAQARRGKGDVQRIDQLLERPDLGTQKVDQPLEPLGLESSARHVDRRGGDSLAVLGKDRHREGGNAGDEDAAVQGESSLTNFGKPRLDRGSRQPLRGRGEADESQYVAHGDMVDEIADTPAADRRYS